jgi:hypothetical protein
MLQNLISPLCLLAVASTYLIFTYLFLVRRFTAISVAIEGLSRWSLAWRFLVGKPLLDIDGYISEKEAANIACHGHKEDPAPTASCACNMQKQP